MKLFRILTFNLVLTLAILAVLEVGSRVLAPVSLPDPMITGDRGNWTATREFDPVLFWRLKPGASLTVGDTVNSLGLRGGEIGPKADTEFRIISLGESTTAALRLAEEETYSHRLQELLGPVEGKTVRVINAGSPGYTLYQGAKFLEVAESSLRPDMVLTYFGHNDFIRVSFRTQRDAASSSETSALTDLELGRQRSKPLTRAFLWLQLRSNFVRLLAAEDSPTSIAMSKKARVPEADRHEIYERLRTFCEERDIPLVVAVPIYRDFRRHRPLLYELAESGFRVIDLPGLLGPEVRTPEYFFDPVHPRASLHKMIGDALAEELATDLGTVVRTND